MHKVHVLTVALRSIVRLRAGLSAGGVILVACLTFVSLLGCSTPQDALTEANHTTKLMSLLDMQLKELRRVERASEEEQQKALAAQRDVLNRLQTSAQLEATASRSSGDTRLAELTQGMLSDADAVAATRDATAALSAAYAKTMANLITPLADSAPGIAQAQAKMAPMGAELDRETRAKELVQFAKDVRKSVDENKAKIKDAEKTAATAAAAAASGAAGATAP